MESQFFEIIKFKNQNVVSRFNQFRRFARLLQICEAVVVLGLISWSSAAVLNAAGRYLVQFSTYLFNYHVVFLIGNIIIVLLLVLCRCNDSGDDLLDFYDEYLKHSELAVRSTLIPPIQSPAAEYGEEKQIVVPRCDDVSEIKSSAAEYGEEKQIVFPQYEDVSEFQSSAVESGEEKQIVVCEAKAVSQCDDVLEMRKLERAKSEKLEREFSAVEVRRSRTRNGREMEYSGGGYDAVDIDNLSSEEFRRTVDAFIDKHWSKRNQINEQKHRFLVKA